MIFYKSGLTRPLNNYILNEEKILHYFFAKFRTKFVKIQNLYLVFPLKIYLFFKCTYTGSGSPFRGIFEMDVMFLGRAMLI